MRLEEVIGVNAAFLSVFSKFQANPTQPVILFIVSDHAWQHAALQRSGWVHLGAAPQDRSKGLGCLGCLAGGICLRFWAARSMGSRRSSRGGAAVRRPKSPYSATGDISLHSFEVSRTGPRADGSVPAQRRAAGRPQHDPCPREADVFAAQSSFDSFNDERRRKLRCVLPRSGFCSRTTRLLNVARACDQGPPGVQGVARSARRRRRQTKSNGLSRQKRLARSLVVPCIRQSI
jgi:hypothetical protein